MVNIHVENCYLQVENHSKIFCLQVFYLAVCPESSVIQDLIFNCIVSCIRGNRLIDIKFHEAILESTSVLKFQCLDSNCKRK